MTRRQIVTVPAPADEPEGTRLGWVAGVVVVVVVLGVALGVWAYVHGL